MIDRLEGHSILNVKKDLSRIEHRVAYGFDKTRVDKDMGAPVSLSICVSVYITLILTTSVMRITAEI